MNGRSLATTLALVGLGLGLGSLLAAGRPTNASDFPLRARLPQLAADSGTFPQTPTTAPLSTPTNLTLCIVSHIVDGDTVDVNGCAAAGRIRLILVNTPEISPGECFGKQAAAHTTERLLNRQVGLEKDKSETDSFGRLLRYIWVDGELFNEHLVREGYAAVGIYPPDVKYLARMEAAEQEAKAHGRGLWPICGGLGVPGTPTPVQSPTSTASPPATPPGTATPTPTVGGACGAASAAITALDKYSEVVTVSGSGNLTGWYVISVRGNQRFDFPANFTLTGTVQVRSGTPEFANSPSQLWWTSANQWSNSEDDDAALYNCTGQLVSYYDD